MRKTKTTRPRRKFLLSALIIGLASSLGLYRGMHMIKRKESGKTLRLITRDGKIVEVEAGQIEHRGSTPLSDEQLDQFKRTDAKHRSNVKRDDKD